MKAYGYLRVSTDKQDEENQRAEILRHMDVDEFIAVECSSRKSQAERGITELFDRLDYGDVLVVTELSRLARSTSELLVMIDELIRRKIGLVAIKQGIRIPPNGERMDASTKTVVTMFGLMAELERDFISMRTKMGLAARKAAGVKLGKPKGTLHRSKLDSAHVIIEKMIAEGKSVRSISAFLGCSLTTLRSYIKNRHMI